MRHNERNAAFSLGLGVVRCHNTSNFSQAYASIPFDQIVRQLLAPISTAVNLILKGFQPNILKMTLVSHTPLCMKVAITYSQYRWW